MKPKSWEKLTDEFEGKLLGQQFADWSDIEDFIRQTREQAKQEVLDDWQTAIFYSETDEQRLDKKCMINHFRRVKSELKKKGIE